MQQTIEDALRGLDGEVESSEEVLASFADDFSRSSHRAAPLAVFRPRTAEAVSELMVLARRHGVRVTVRGQGHTTGGQSLAPGGIVLDTRGLHGVWELSEGAVWVGAGTLWSELVHETLSSSLMPPVLTGYLGLSVGGTLSVGGIGLRSYRYGAQTDNVLELEVVTGAGEHFVCSPDRHADLFDACRAGLGQFGTICAARLRLVEAPARVHAYDLLYTDPQVCLREQERLMQQGRFAEVGSMVVPHEGRWAYLLQLAFDGGPDSDGAGELLDDLPPPDGGCETMALSCREFVDRVEAKANAMKDAGLWAAPHPWTSFFLPASRMPDFVEELTVAMQVDDLGYGSIGLYPLRRGPFRTPGLRLPSDELFYLLAILPNAFPPSPERTAKLVELGRAFYRRCIDMGGTLYPIGLCPNEGWRLEAHPRRRELDPGGVLAPGLG